MNLYKDVIIDCVVHDIDVALKNSAPTGAVLLTYCAIDAMAFLSMPLSEKKQRRNDFIAWAEKYMKTDSTQPYQYRGIDLYGARSGIVHTYGVESDGSREGKCKVFAYKPNCQKHFYDSRKYPEMVIIGVNLFIKDFFNAVDKFLEDIVKDNSLKQRVDLRLPKLFRISRKPSKTSDDSG